MGAGADLGRHDVGVHHEQAAPVDCIHYGRDLCLAIACRHGIQGGLHEIGAVLVDALELARVERGLKVVAAPDVVNAALAPDQKLIDVGRGLAAGIIRSDTAIGMRPISSPDALVIEIQRGE